MSKRIQLRRGTTAEANAFTGAVGEVTVDTDKKTVVVHDGTTAGGTPLARVSEVPSLVPQATEAVAGKAKITTTAIAQAGTNDTDIITAKKLRDAMNATGSAPTYACRAWVNFNGTGTVAIRASGNVSSITDNGTGDYTINFATVMPDENYAAALTHAGGAESFAMLMIRSETQQGLATLKTASALRITCKAISTTSLYDLADANVVIFR